MAKAYLVEFLFQITGGQKIFRKYFYGTLPRIRSKCWVLLNAVSASVEMIVWVLFFSLTYGN